MKTCFNRPIKFLKSLTHGSVFEISSKYFSIFKYILSTGWVAHITRDFSVFYSCCYYSFTKFQIWALKEAVVSLPYRAVFTFPCYRRTSLPKIYWWLLILITSIIISGSILLWSLNILIAKVCRLHWWKVTELSYPKRWWSIDFKSLYTSRSTLSWKLLSRLFKVFLHISEETWSWVFSLLSIATLRSFRKYVV